MSKHNEICDQFNEFAKEFKSQLDKEYATTKWDTISEDSLKSVLNRITQQLSHFAEYYNKFEQLIQNDRVVVSLEIYKDRALTYMMICQNQYIIPIDNEITKRNNENLLLKANEAIDKANISITQGANLLKKARSSSYFALGTFILSFILSAVSIFITYKGNKDSQSIANNSIYKVNEIKQNSINNSIKIEYIQQQNLLIQQKLDSILFKK